MYLKHKPDLTTSDPITHPIYGAAPVQPAAANGYGYPDQSGQFQPPPTQPYPGQTPGGFNPAPAAGAALPPPFAPPSRNTPFAPPPSGGTFNPGNFNQNAIGESVFNCNRLVSSV